MAYKYNLACVYDTVDAASDPAHAQQRDTRGAQANIIRICGEPVPGTTHKHREKGESHPERTDDDDDDDVYEDTIC